MKIEKLSKKKNGLYEIEFADETRIILNEDTVLKYHLFVNKDITLNAEIMQYDERQSFYNKALSYAVKYNKSSKEVINYLTDKDLSTFIAKDIVNELIKKKIINDQLIANSVAASLARNSNGSLLIRFKLKKRLFTDDVIDLAIESLSKDDIEYGLEKLKAKLNKQYAKENSQIRNYKLKKQLYAHGYGNGE